MGPDFSLLQHLDRLNSLSLLLGFALLALFLALLYATGLLGLLLSLVQKLFQGSIWLGFLIWRRCLSWAQWPAFLVLVFGLLAIGMFGGERFPYLGLLCGLLLLVGGISTCLAYVLIDLERYEVARGYKALHKPLQGQELASNLVRYGPQVGPLLMILASVAVIGGFTLTNDGLYLTIGEKWFRAEGGEGSLGIHDFLAYTLINLSHVVDLLHIASSWKVAVVTYVVPVKWPASMLLVLFKSFFTLVLLQQVFASVRRGRLLSETITDFWSPHAPIHERARGSLAQYGPGAVRPLLRSLRLIEGVTVEQWADLPQVLADIGPVSVPMLRHHLHDPHESVRGVAATALGELHALEALPDLARLLEDPSERVRRDVVAALGVIAGPRAHAARRVYVGFAPALTTWAWLQQMIGMTRETEQERESVLPLLVEALRSALRDSAMSVRVEAARSLAHLEAAAAEAAPDLIALLIEPDEELRVQTAEALGKVHGDVKATVTALTMQVRDSSPKVQVAAARALGELKKDAAEAVPALVVLVQDTHEEVREAAAAAVAAIGVLEEEAVHKLTQGLRSPDNMVRAQTAQALGEIGAPAADAAPALAKALADNNDRVRAKAAEALGKLGEGAEKAVPQLVRALRDQDTWVSALAAEALGEIGNGAAEAVPALMRSLRHANPVIRARAAEALGKVGETAQRAVPALTAAANDIESVVRRESIIALSQVGGLTLEARRAVLAGLKDDHPGVRAATVEAIGRCPDLHGEGWAALLPVIEDASEDVKLQVPAALAQATGVNPQALEALSRMLHDNSAAVQARAALALGKLGHDAAAVGPALLESARIGEATVREQSLRALALIEPPEAVQAFLDGLKDVEPEVRKIASAGLVKTGALPETLPDLLGALHDAEAQVRANAAQVLTRMDSLPEEAVEPLRACLSEHDDGIRLHAALALRKLPPGVTATAFQELLGDPNPRLRLLAVRFFLEIDPIHPEAGVALLECLADPSRHIRRSARELFDAMGPRAVSLLEPLKVRAEAEVDPEISDLLAGLVEDLERRQAEAAVAVATADTTTPAVKE
jgi:HEAT repeat protein